LRLRNNGSAPRRESDAAAPQYARQPLEIQELRTKKTLAALPREGSQSE
jgi:hypothetical protein